MELILTKEILQKAKERYQQNGRMIKKVFVQLPDSKDRVELINEKTQEVINILKLIRSK